VSYKPKRRLRLRRPRRPEQRSLQTIKQFLEPVELLLLATGHGSPFSAKAPEHGDYGAGPEAARIVARHSKAACRNQA
jgi:hypothetical protein